MSDLIYLGKDVQSFQTAPRYAAYDQVVLNIDDNNYVSSPNARIIDASKWDARDNGEYVFTYRPAMDRWHTPFGTNANIGAMRVNYGIEYYYPQFTSPKDGDIITVIKSSVNDEVTVTAELSRSGSKLEADCPLVSPNDRQRVADNLLWSVFQFEYQPFSASGAYMTPAAEVGDGVTAYGIYAGMFEQETIFNRLMLSNIGSAISNEAEAEMNYENASDRKYIRKLAETSATLAIFADRISQSVTSAEFRSAMDLVNDEIRAKVGSTGGDGLSFAWSLTPNGFFLYANGVQVFKCDSTGITVTGDGTFTGNVYAKNIKYSTSNPTYGTMPGAAITPSSIYGGSYGQIAPASITGGSYGNIAAATVAAGNTSFQGTLSQVGVNKSNIEAINGYFTGTANFNYAIVRVLQAGALTLNGHSTYLSDGYIKYQ